MLNDGLVVKGTVVMTPVVYIGPVGSVATRQQQQRRIGMLLLRPSALARQLHDKHTHIYRKEEGETGGQTDRQTDTRSRRDKIAVTLQVSLRALTDCVICNTRTHGAAAAAACVASHRSG